MKFTSFEINQVHRQSLFNPPTHKHQELLSIGQFCRPYERTYPLRISTLDLVSKGAHL